MEEDWLFPPDVELAFDLNSEGEDGTEQVGGVFTPIKVLSEEEVNYAGVRIKQLPKDADQGEVIEFLCRWGLSEEKKDDITFKANGTVTVKNLNDEE